MSEIAIVVPDARTSSRMPPRLGARLVGLQGSPGGEKSKFNEGIVASQLVGETPGEAGRSDSACSTTVLPPGSDMNIRDVAAQVKMESAARFLRNCTSQSIFSADVMRPGVISDNLFAV